MESDWVFTLGFFSLILSWRWQSIFQKHVINSAFYYLYNLRRVRKYLSKDNTKTLVHTFISYRIDFYMACLSIKSLSYRTCVLVRLICNESKYCHITSLPVDLHWHTVKFRIEFKILLIVFQIFKVLAPSYLSFLITPKHVSTGCFKSSFRFFLRLNFTDY